MRVAKRRAMPLALSLLLSCALLDSSRFSMRLSTGNSSCRLESVEAVRTLLPMNIMVVAFDFSGCGLSEGEYISLGYYEKEDVNILINHLRERDIVTRIALWGRSMGAVTAIQCAQADPSIACIVCDSPFSSLHTLAMELVQHSDVNIPGIMLKLAFGMVRKSVKKRAKFDIKYVIIQYICLSNCIPILKFKKPLCHETEDQTCAEGFIPNNALLSISISISLPCSLPCPLITFIHPTS